MIAAEVVRRDGEAMRQFGFLLRFLTPRTVFMEIGAPDGALALRAAGYVERVWCVDAAARPARAPCNLRCGPLGGVPLASIDVAFSAGVGHAEEIRALLAPGGVWFVHASFVPSPTLRGAGFSRVQYYVGGLALPAALARVSRNVITAAYKAQRER